MVVAKRPFSEPSLAVLASSRSNLLLPDPPFPQNQSTYHFGNLSYHARQLFLLFLAVMALHSLANKKKTGWVCFLLWTGLLVSPNMDGRAMGFPVQSRNPRRAKQGKERQGLAIWQKAPVEYVADHMIRAGLLSPLMASPQPPTVLGIAADGAFTRTDLVWGKEDLSRRVIQGLGRRDLMNTTRPQKRSRLPASYSP